MLGLQTTPDAPHLISDFELPNATPMAGVTYYTQPHSGFFTTLNYDVRCVIFDCMYKWLPPLARKWHANGFPQEDTYCRGLILSCKLANLEALEAAERHLKIFLARFRKKFERYHGKPIALCREPSLNISMSWQALRSVTLSVGVKIIPPKTRWNYQWQMDIEVSAEKFDDPLRKLLLRPFDEVTMLFTCPDVEAHEAPGDAEEGLWDHLMQMQGTIPTAISSDWVEFLHEDDKRNYLHFRENPHLILPHIREAGNVRCIDDACHECNSDCPHHWECEHTDDMCDRSLCDENCQGPCDGEDPECRWKHVSVDICSRPCKYFRDKDASEPGPKRSDYTSDDEHRYAYAQWKRISSGKLGSRRKRLSENYADALTRKRIQAKSITFAWDYRSSAAPLNGPLHSGRLQGCKERYDWEHVRRVARADAWSVPQTDAEYDREWPYEYYLNSVGRNRSKGEMRLVGMWKLGHQKRWMLASQEPLDENNGIDEGVGLWLGQGREEEVQCEGLGMPIVPRSAVKDGW